LNENTRNSPILANVPVDQLKCLFRRNKKRRKKRGERKEKKQKEKKRRNKRRNKKRRKKRRNKKRRRGERKRTEKEKEENRMGYPGGVCRGKSIQSRAVQTLEY